METGNITIDQGTLTVYDCSSVNESTDFSLLNQMTTKAFNMLKEKLREDLILQQQEQNLRKLEHQVVDFDKNPNEIKLPKSNLELPRLLKYNPSAYKTKWEKFAEEKGIKKKSKRSRMVFSEETGDWESRWGKNSIKHIKEDLDIIRVVKDGEDPNSDPFKQSKLEKGAGRKKQEYREMQNDLRRQGINPNKALREQEKRSKKIKKGSDYEGRKEKMAKSIELSKRSTASMGRINEKGEKIIEKKKLSIGVRTNFSSSKAEISRTKDILKRVLSQ